MKKKFVFLAVTALLSVGLAFYVNQQNSTQVLLESDVEALTGSGDPGGDNPYIQFGSSPTCITVDTDTHVLVIEGKRQAYDENGKQLNGCIIEEGSVCVIHTTTRVYNLGQVMSYVESFLKVLCTAMPLIQWVCSLFS